MYTEEEERKGLPIKTFLISLILIIIFVLLLVWLLPMPNMDGLNNRIFNANIQEMKDAAIPYFTTDKLPQNVGDEVKLTLQEMIDMKLLLPFTDKNGDACDTEKSYVILTKKEDHYELKVNLKCNEEEDYIIVTLGCYSYCTSAICEKEPEQKPTPSPKPTPKPSPVVSGPSCVLYVENGTLGQNGWYTSNATVKFKSKTTGSNASIVNYGLSTGSTTYNGNNTLTVTSEGKTTVYGYVKDSNGKTATCSIVVKKDTQKPSCTLQVTSGTKGSDGTYNSNVTIGFGSKTDATSGINAFGITNSTKVTYNNQTNYVVSTNGSHKIYGYVKDQAGNTATCNISVTRNAKQDSVPSCTLKVTSGKAGTNGWYVGNVTVAFETKKSTNGATISSYGIGTSQKYDGTNTYTVSADGTTTVYGYVKDTNGNTATCSIVVKKDATVPKCSLKVTNGTYNSNGYYTSNITVGFGSKTDATSGILKYGIGKQEAYNSNSTYEITTVGSHTIYGYVMDNAGNKATCSITVEKRNNLEYQYKKDIAAQYSAWSDWKTYTYLPSDAPKFGNFALYEVVDLGKTQEVDYYNYSVGDPIYKTTQVKIGTVKQTYCAGYKYYRTTTSTTTTTYAVADTEDWVYQGRITTTGYPTDTLTVKYEFVGFVWPDDCATCTTASYKVFNKYTRKVGTVSSQNTVTTNGVTATCAKTETKEVEIFANAKEVVGYEKIRTAVMRDVYRYKQRTRTLIQKAYIDYKWSYYNDQNLLGQGYTLTGATRVAN